MARKWKRCEDFRRDHRKGIVEKDVGLSPEVAHYSYCPIHEKTLTDATCHYCRIVAGLEHRL